MPDMGFRILDLVWHWFSIGLHAGLDDKELVCMPVCGLRALVLDARCAKCQIDLDFGQFGLPLVCIVQTMQTGKPIAKVCTVLPPDVGRVPKKSRGYPSCSVRTKHWDKLRR